MARAKLQHCAPALRGRVLAYARRVGTVTILTASGGAATVYSDSTGTGTITSTAVPFNAVLDSVEGWVEPGEYQVSVSGITQPVDVMAGDGLSIPPVQPTALLEPATSCQNFPYYQCNSIAATTTSQTAKFVRIVPQAEITAAKVVSASGAAIVTITGSFVGLYTTDGTTLTRVAVNSTNTTSGLWDTANTMYRQALNPATVKLSAGTVYYVGMLVNASTAGAHLGWVKVSNQADVAATEVPVPMYTLAGQTSLPTSQAIAGLTSAFNLVPWVAITA